MTQTAPTPTLNAGLSVTTFGRATGYYDGEGLFGRGTFDAEGNFELDDFGGGFVEAVQAMERAMEAGNE
jgi:hypothetical protein